ncbi:MAG: hypothetical protein LBG89_00470 [Rickettsiales bacterium]|jgi:cell division protein FtsX|nr:hypothetical protein [Rickettsiales bacterium]
MIRKSAVFQPSRDQSVFLAGMAALMTFLIVLSLGVALALSNASQKWSRSWDMKATIQVLPGGDADAVKKILKDESARVKTIYQMSEAELSRMLKPWVHGRTDMSAYLPVQIDLTFNSPADIEKVSARLESMKGVKFISHSDAVKNIVVFGGAVGVLAFVIIVFVGAAAGMAIVFATLSIIKIHGREIDILAVVGAYDSFAVNQISVMILRLAAVGAAAGLFAGALAVFGVLEVAAAQKTGIVSAMALNPFDILKLGLAPVALSLGAFFVSRLVVRRALSEGAFK